MSNRNEYMRRWRAANPQKVAAANRAYRAKHRKRLDENNRAWVAANPKRRAATAQRWRAKDKNRASRAWARRNPDKVNAKSSWRRAQVIKGTCKCCKRKEFVALYALARWLSLEVDHIRPLSKRGQHCMSNLQLLTRHENRTKHAKWVESV